MDAIMIPVSVLGTPTYHEVGQLREQLDAVFNFLERYKHVDVLKENHGGVRELFRDLRGTLNSEHGPMVGVN